MRKKKKVKSNHYLYILPAIVLVGVLIFFGQYTHHPTDDVPFDLPTSGDTIIVPTDDIVHSHFDFKVFINEEEIDFDREEFDTVNRFIHMHLGNLQGDKVVHVHARNLKVGFFFNTIGMNFDSECFSLETNEEFCNDDENKLRFFVNGEENFEFGEYVPRDLDRILITYGNNEISIQEQIESVTDYACIPSGKCPEREISDSIVEGLPSI